MKMTTKIFLLFGCLVSSVLTSSLKNSQWQQQQQQQQTQVWMKPVIPSTRSPEKKKGCDLAEVEAKLDKLQKNVNKLEKLQSEFENLKKEKEDSVSCQLGTSSNHGGTTLKKPQSYETSRVWFRKVFNKVPTVVAALRHVVFGHEASNIFVVAENATTEGFMLQFFWDKPSDADSDMSHMKASWIACEEPEMKYGRILPEE